MTWTGISDSANNWDALFKTSFKNVKYAREKVYNWIANFQTLTHIDTFDGPLHWLPWEDQEIYEILQYMITSEEEMINILKKLPEGSVMHRVRHTKFKEVSRLRIELERLLVNLAAEYRRPLFPPVTVVEAPPRPTVRPETPPDAIPKRYDGDFVIYWDYILNLLDKFQAAQIIYGLYNKGETILQPRVVSISDNMSANFLAQKMGYCMYDIYHHVKQIEANPDTLLIFEVHVKPKVKDVPKVVKEGRAAIHNGYPLRRFDTGDPKLKEDTDLVDDIRWKSFGWSFIQVYNLEDELRAGVWKVPIYKPPANVTIDISNFANEVVRIPNTMVWMRLDYPDEPQTVKCHPSYAHVYTVPPIHNVLVREEADTPERPGYDPSYKNRGFQIYVHYGTGYFPSRKVRVAVCLQYRKDILFDEDNMLCFYATSGKNPNTFIMEGVEDKTAMGDVILWNENTTFIRDFYLYLWDIWERELKKNLY